eukprot:303753-Pyramimonas_sp.AAC.1
MHSRPALLDSGDDRAGGSQGTWNSTQSADSHCTRPRAWAAWRLEPTHHTEHRTRKSGTQRACARGGQAG